MPTPLPPVLQTSTVRTLLADQARSVAKTAGHACAEASSSSEDGQRAEALVQGGTRGHLSLPRPDADQKIYYQDLKAVLEGGVILCDRIDESVLGPFRGRDAFVDELKKLAGSDGIIAASDMWPLWRLVDSFDRNGDWASIQVAQADALTPSGAFWDLLLSGFAPREEALALLSPAVGVSSRAFSASKKTRVIQAEALLSTMGLAIEPHQTYVVAIDRGAEGLSRMSPKNRSDSLLSYQGKMCVFVANGKGELREVQGPLTCSTLPSRVRTEISHTPDINRDGEPDIAHVRPGAMRMYFRRNRRGRYNASGQSWDSADQTWISSSVEGTAAVPAARDQDQDGLISASEDRIGEAATFIQIHGAGKTPDSVGCTTMPNKEKRKLDRALSRIQNGQREFVYVLARTGADATATAYDSRKLYSDIRPGVRVGPYRNTVVAGLGGLLERGPAPISSIPMYNQN